VPAPDPTAPWWTTTDVAAYLGVSLSTVSGYRGRGQMPAEEDTIDGKRVWRPATIIEWHKSRPSSMVRAAVQHSAANYDIPAGQQATAFTIAAGIDWANYRLDCDVEWVESSPELAELFAVPAKTRLLVKHLRFFNRGEAAPRQMSTSHLLASMVEGTPVADPNKEPWAGGTKDQMRTLGSPVTKIEESGRARMPTEHEAATLQLADGEPVLAILRRMFSGGRVVEVNREIVIPGSSGVMRAETDLA
jgi:hypothetical protein